MQLARILPDEDRCETRRRDRNSLRKGPQLDSVGRAGFAAAGDPGSVTTATNGVDATVTTWPRPHSMPPSNIGTASLKRPGFRQSSRPEPFPDCPLPAPRTGGFRLEHAA